MRAELLAGVDGAAAAASGGAAAAAPPGSVPARGGGAAAAAAPGSVPARAARAPLTLVVPDHRTRIHDETRKDAHGFNFLNASSALPPEESMFEVVVGVGTSVASRRLYEPRPSRRRNWGWGVSRARIATTKPRGGRKGDTDASRRSSVPRCGGGAKRGFAAARDGWDDASWWRATKRAPTVLPRATPTTSPLPIDRSIA